MMMKKRNIRLIVIHCTATSEQTAISSIQTYWKKVLHWRKPGYHYVVKANGEWVQLAMDHEVTNGGERTQCECHTCGLRGWNPHLEKRQDGGLRHADGGSTKNAETPCGKTEMDVSQGFGGGASRFVARLERQR